MYAIRSYYAFWYTNEYMPAGGLWATRVGSFGFHACTNLVYYWASGITTTTRITSYNVCYTKLLRAMAETEAAPGAARLARRFARAADLRTGEAGALASAFAMFS